MGNVLRAYTEQYECENQMLFQAIINLRRDDKKFFEQVYKLSERYIYAIIYRIIRDNEKAADLMQDTYIQIYKKIHSLKNVEAFFVWTGRIATNNTLRFIQKDSRDVLLKEEENDFIFENARDDKEKFLPEDILVNKEKREKIREIINNLSQEQKITVLFYYFAEMSVSEIAQAMQCSTGTVKSRLNYARKQIKKAVLDTEKREGVKLYSLSALPLFTLLLRDEMANIAVPKMVLSSVVKGIAEALGVNIAGAAGIEAAEIVQKGIKGIKETIRKFFETTGGKVASGAAVAVVAGTVAITQISTPLYVTSNRILESVYGCVHNDFYAYSSEDTEFKYLIDGRYLIFQNDDGQVGLYTIDGKEVLPIEFDDIECNDYTGGLLRVQKGNKQTYYDKSVQIVCDGMYESLSDVIDGVFYCVEDYDDYQCRLYSVDGTQISDSTYDEIGI
ncbi:MAG: sigma-70 family RNA polymerase sigma factor [Clostridia bacterium]